MAFSQRRLHPPPAHHEGIRPQAPTRSVTQIQQTGKYPPHSAETHAQTPVFPDLVSPNNPGPRPPGSPSPLPQFSVSSLPSLPKKKTGIVVAGGNPDARTRTRKSALD